VIIAAAPELAKSEEMEARTDAWDSEREEAAAEREEVSTDWRSEREESREEKAAEKEEMTGPENSPFTQQ
jgi:hypothetical protein